MIATCRDPDKADGLHALASQHGDRLQLVPLDVTSEESIQVWWHLEKSVTACCYLV